MLLHWFQVIMIFLYVCQSGSWHTSLMKSKNLGISPALYQITLWIFDGHMPGMLVHLFQIILNFWHVCQSFSWLTSLLKLDKCRDISCSGWDIFLKFFWDIPWMFVHLFQIISNFLLVCQSFSLITSLLKLGNIGISPVLDEIFSWNFFEIFLGYCYSISK